MKTSRIWLRRAAMALPLVMLIAALAYVALRTSPMAVVRVTVHQVAE